MGVAVCLLATKSRHSLQSKFACQALAALLLANVHAPIEASSDFAKLIDLRDKYTIVWLEHDGSESHPVQHQMLARLGHLPKPCLFGNSAAYKKACNL